ncbi:MAG: glycosyltransferase [Deltaproteobacteria bacterium]|nr:glycosyltransferase [Deltaproteobacteria bacterium]
MGPLVSIVVPSFRQAAFLRTAIDSILSQGYAPLEVLALDGGSEDGSREILESYGDRIWFRSERDGGQCQAINEGFRRSRGEIVAWLNSDDFYYPGAVAHAVEVLGRNPGAALVYGEGNLVAEDGSVLWRFPETVPFDLWRLANHSDYILQPTVFFRRDALFECGLLAEDLNWGLDWELWIRLGKRFPFCYTGQVLAASRIYGATKTATGGYRRLAEIVKILRRHGVSGLSPAAVSHAIITVVRKFCGNAELITPEVMTASVPGRLRTVVSPLVEGTERSLRRWLQNVQGLWRDGLVGKRGRLWVPSDGSACRLGIEGKNLDLAGQRVELRTAGRTASTGSLGPGESFRLELPVPAGNVPVRAELACAATVEVPPLDPRLGPRRAGFVLADYRLGAP